LSQTEEISSSCLAKHTKFFITVTKRSLSYLDHGLSSGIFL